MIRNYLLSFLAMEYMGWMMLPTIAIFILIFLFLKAPTNLMRILVGVIAVALAFILVKYNIDKFNLKKKIRSLEDFEDYDTAVLLGRTFFTEKRMLHYQKRSFETYDYSQIQEVRKDNDTKKDGIVIVVEGKQLQVPTGSLSQSNRTATFLHTKNPNVVLHELSLEGNGTLHNIDKMEGKLEL